ncbi:FRIGIDA-like protein 3 [Linum grandiflorum]
MERHVGDGAGVSISVQSVDGGGQPYSQCTVDEFRNQVSSFAAQLNSAAAAMEERSRKLRQEEQRADRVRKELDRRSMELHAREETFRLLSRKEIADRRKQEGELVVKLNKEIERQSVEIGEQAAEIRRMKSELVVCMGELDARKNEIGEKEEAVEGWKRKSMELEAAAEAERRKSAEALQCLEKKEIADRRKLEEFVKKMKNQIETKEKEIEEQAAELRTKQTEFELRMSELDAREKETDEKEKQCTRPWFEEQFKMLSKRFDNVVGEQFKRIDDDFDSRDTKIVMKSGESVPKVRKIRYSVDHPSEADVSLRGKQQLEERLDREVYDFDLKAKKLCESFDCSSEATIKVCVTMNGKELQVYLNEHSDELNSVKDEVERALRLSPDPTKLVLDAMEGFFPPHLKIEFKAGVVRKSCMMLLESLTKMSPYIRPSVREEAKKLAFYWNEMVNEGSNADADVDHSLKVLAFLQLLAAFEVASCFDDNQLATQLGIIAHYSQAPVLLRDLGFADKMSSIIQEKLIQRNHLAEAAGLISAFELHCEFPSVILPKWNHQGLFNLAPFLVDNDAAPPITSVLRSFFKTDPITPDLRSSGQLSGAKWSVACTDVNNTKSPDRDPVMSSNSLAHQQETSKLPVRQPRRLPRPVRLPEWLTSPGGTHLEALCDKIASDHKLFCIEISDALRLAPDPAEFVLGVAMNPSSLTLKKRHKQVSLAFPEHGLLLLLNRMWRMSSHVKPHVQREALSFAKNWQSKLAGKVLEGHFESVCFLLFLAAYKLVTYFDRDELFSVVVGRENRSLLSTKLFATLGFNDYYIPTSTNLSTSRPTPSNPTISSCSSSPASPDERPPYQHLKKRRKTSFGHRDDHRPVDRREPR